MLHNECRSPPPKAKGGSLNPYGSEGPEENSTDHDPPASLIIAGHNVQSLRVHQDHILARAAHVLVVTETDVPESEVYATRGDFRDAQCQIHFGAKTSLTEAGSVGRRVGIITRLPIQALELAFITSDLVVLADSGRWVERVIPFGTGDKFIIIAGFYGYSGSSSDGALLRDTERLLATALARASQFKATPYYLIGDINITPEDSPSVATSIQSGLIFDIAKDWASDWRNVQTTFYKPGVHPLWVVKDAHESMSYSVMGSEPSLSGLSTTSGMLRAALTTLCSAPLSPSLSSTGRLRLWTPNHHSTPCSSKV